MASGKEITLGFKQASTWRTPVALGAGDGLLVKSLSLGRNQEVHVDDSAGTSFPYTQDTGLITCSGSMNSYLRWRGMERFLAMVMGRAAAPTQPEGATKTYEHKLTYKSATNGTFGTMAANMGVSVHEYPSVKVSGFGLSGNMGQPMELNFDLLANNRARNTTSGTNTKTSMASVTPPTDGDGALHTSRVLFRQAQIRLNELSGSALSASDNLGPVSFNLNFKRNYTSDHPADHFGEIAEPYENGFPEGTMTFDFGEYTEDKWHDWAENQTELKAEIIFTGPKIESGQNYAMAFKFPRLLVNKPKDAEISGPAKIGFDASLNILKPLDDAPGMTGIDMPMQIEITNDSSAQIIS